MMSIDINLQWKQRVSKSLILGGNMPPNDDYDMNMIKLKLRNLYFHCLHQNDLEVNSTF